MTTWDEVFMEIDKLREEICMYAKEESVSSVLKRGVESVAYFPNDMDWVDACVESDLYLHVTNEEGELK